MNKKSKTLNLFSEKFEILFSDHFKICVSKHLKNFQKIFVYVELDFGI